jgi:hypothetical protein
MGRPVRRIPVAVNQTIGLDVESNLMWGHFFGIGDIEDFHTLQANWRTFGKAITERWIEAFPGSRPMAAYLCGDIPPWVWENPTESSRHPIRSIRGLQVTLDTSGHMLEPELEHLEQLGLLTDEEWKAADRRLDDPYPTNLSRYRRLCW